MNNQYNDTNYNDTKELMMKLTKLYTVSFQMVNAVWAF